MIQHSDTISEKDPTTYLFRRNFATHLHTLGFPLSFSQYYMGHLIENDILKRSDFNDEGYLFEMAKLLEKHPLNGITNQPKTIIIPGTFAKSYIVVENNEVNDPISVYIDGEDVSASIIATRSTRELPVELHISRFFSNKNFNVQPI